jgi:glycosyltransferase involved in cell wall biosynthesis
MRLLENPYFIKSVDAQIYVSHWQYEKFRQVYKVPTDNSYVIKNAINNIEFIKKPKNEKIKLVYISTPWRGLDVLIKSFEMLNRDDVELDVYSSVIIYGDGFASAVGDRYEELFKKAKSTKNINYKGYASNEEIIKSLQESHIFAYPSTFEETSCLSMIEAGAAGCELVTTDLGALFETGSEYAKMIPMQYNKIALVEKYTKVLNESIDNYWNKENQNRLKEQSDFYNKYYSWEKRKDEWNALLEKVSND